MNWIISSSHVVMNFENTNLQNFVTKFKSERIWSSCCSMKGIQRFKWFILHLSISVLIHLTCCKGYFFEIGCAIFLHKLKWIVLSVHKLSLILTKTHQSLLVSKEFSKFWWLLWFPAKNHPPQTFLSPVYGLTKVFTIVFAKLLSNWIIDNSAGNIQLITECHAHIWWRQSCPDRAYTNHLILMQ